MPAVGEWLPEKNEGTGLKRECAVHCSASSTKSQPNQITTQHTKGKMTQPIATPPSKPCVSFFPYVEVLDTLHIKDYSAEEAASCWYSSEELKSIKQENKTIVREMEHSIENNVDELCIRGLEMRTRQQRLRRRFLLEEVRLAVFEEQDMQWRRVVCDPSNAACDSEGICAASCEQTRESAILARLMGLADQEQLFFLDMQQKHQQQQDLLAAIKMEDRCCASIISGTCSGMVAVPQQQQQQRGRDPVRRPRQIAGRAA